MIYSSAKENYALFLESDLWKQIRVECFRRDGWMCRHCGIGSNGKLQAHHVLYPDDWYQTTLDHLITLCRSCHENAHGIKKQDQKVKKEKTKKSSFKWYPGVYEGKRIEPKKPVGTKPTPISRNKQIKILRSQRLITRMQFKELLRNSEMPIPSFTPAVASATDRPVDATLTSG